MYPIQVSVSMPALVELMVALVVAVAAYSCLSYFFKWFSRRLIGFRYPNSVWRRRRPRRSVLGRLRRRIARSFSLITGWLAGLWSWLAGRLLIRHHNAPSEKLMNPKIEPIDKRLVLDELRRALDKSYEASDALDGKLQQLLGYTSLIIALSGTLQLTILRQLGGILFWVILVIVLLLYAAIFIITFAALRPRTRKLPITMNWEILDELYFDKGETSVLERLISDHLTDIEESNKINSEKARAVRALMVLVFLLVVVLLIATPISFSVSPIISPLPTP